KIDIRKMSQEMILLPPVPEDIGKARCRVSNVVLEKRKIKAGQWVRSLIPLKTPIQASIDVTLFIKFRYGDDDKEKRQFDDFGFIWENGSETIKHLIHETNPSNSVQLFTCDTHINITDDIDEITSLLGSTTLEEKIPNPVPGLHEAYEALYEITVNGPDIFGPFFGESEKRLRDAFSQAKNLTIKENCSVILFIDELVCLNVKSTDETTETQFHESRVIAQLLTLMDGMESRGRLIVIAATNRPNAIDPALRRPAVDVPSEQSRFEILKSQTFKMPLGDDVDLASVTNGYVGADLASLCREAAMNAVHRQVTLEKNGMDDFTGAMLHVVPSLRRGYHINVGKINWDDIGGLEDVKKQAVEWPIKYRHTFERLGLKPPNGILLYGPPGCSKTTLAKVIASTSGATFLSINGAQLYSPYVGDSEQIIRTTFQRARSTSPSIIFFDEIDAIVGKRSLGSSGNSDSVQERILSMLLNEMDGIEVTTSVLVVVPPPDFSARKLILKIYTSNMPLGDDVDLNLIAKQTELYTGADLKNLCRESAIISLREMGTTSSV
ncbi:7076_t:CDS:10, partial [Racocetra fulgida]